MPEIHFYFSPLCPRCRGARRELERLRQQRPDLTIEEINVLRQPLRSWRAGIRLIPALQAGAQHLSGLWLNPAQLQTFLDRLDADNDRLD
ncbi:glutaredoxin family protein [Desulfuromonas thiophila]|uniref:glutaredoxin family protein n=1 Tax=Desulfuromonas thiophila TaxID=57664 RepID=UPI0024A7BDCE|nr:DsbA family protein [Desulfuromonas thiophila]